MKKLSAIVLSLILCVSVSFAARGGSGNSGNSSSKSSSSSSSSSGSFGLGYSKATFDTGAFAGNVNVDQIAGRIWFNDTLGLDVQLGFGSGDANTRLLLGAKIIGNFIKVNKLNVYWLAGINFGTYKLKNAGPGGDVDCTVFGIHGGVGAEYFVLPCLSVLTEMGLRYFSADPDVDGMDSVNDFGIFADWLPQAGVRFYF